MQLRRFREILPLVLFFTGSVFMLFGDGGDGSKAGGQDTGKNMINPYLGYEPFPPESDPEDFLDDQVSIIGTISTVIWQHMFRGPGDKPYIQECYIELYFDIVDIEVIQRK